MASEKTYDDVNKFGCEKVRVLLWPIDIEIPNFEIRAKVHVHTTTHEGSLCQNLELEKTLLIDGAAKT
jgi:hypothetical protein